MFRTPTLTEVGYLVKTFSAKGIGPARDLSKITKFIVHRTEGNLAGDLQELTQSNDKSAHALIAPDGELYFLVDIYNTAWTPGNDDWAKISINVELSGFTKDSPTEDQYRALANFYKWCVGQGCPIPARYVGKNNIPGLLGHEDVPDPYNPGEWGGKSHHTDPGPGFDWDKFVTFCDQNDNFDPNPNEFNIGPGVRETLINNHMEALTNEQYYSPDDEPSGLSRRSFTWASKDSITYLLVAIQNLDSGNKPLKTWSVQIFELVK